MARNIILKFSKELRGDFEDALETSKDMPTMQIIEQFLTGKFNKLDAMRYQVTPKVEHKHENCEKSAKHGQNQTAVLHNADYSKSRPNRGQVFCGVCDKDHLTEKCPDLAATTEKSALLISKHWCLYCLKHKHVRNFVSRSKDKLRCEIC